MLKHHALDLTVYHTYLSKKWLSYLVLYLITLRNVHFQTHVCDIIDQG